ncbi:hypothetical protein NECAME_19681, partial [Necator americanus]
MYAFGRNESRYVKEKQLINEISLRLFQLTEASTAGIAVYGFVPETRINLNSALNNMAVSHEKFSKNLEQSARIGDNVEHSNTQEAIYDIKHFKNLNGRANCLVFFSA